MYTSTILFIAAFSASAISGAAGFGGALLLLPAIVATVGVTQAVPLLTIAQLIGNLSRAGFGFTQIKWKPVGVFLLGAIPFSILGALSFIQIPKELITRIIGAFILVFVTLTHSGIMKIKSGNTILIIGGGVVGFISGLLGSAGPLGAAIFYSFGFSPVAYIASEATTAIAMHGVKTIVYHHYITLDQNFWLLALVMGVAMILGTLFANRVIERMPKIIFQRFVTILLIVIGGYMLVHG